MHPLNRDAIKSGYFQKIAKAAEEKGLIKLTSAADREASWRSIFQSNPNTCGSFWVFAYGSLLWNPAFRLVDSKDVRLDGYHRDFNLRTYIGRGNPDQPGLVLGLEEGGCCHGQALKIDPNHIEEELDVLWTREMITSAYTPCWVEVHTENKETVHAIAFVIDTRYKNYAGHFSFEEKCFDLAHGTGALGCAADYLFETINALTKIGISDSWLNKCATRVKEIRSNQTK